MNKNAQQKGFTLIELMVTLAIAAILLTVAIPSFSDLIRTNRLTTKTNLFTTGLNLARSEAVKRNVKVVMCKGSGGTCNSTDKWEDGWLVFADTDDGGEEIQVFEALTGAFTLRSTAANKNSVTYLPNGRAESSPAGSYNLCAPNASVNMTNRSRTIIMSASGRIRLQAGASSCP